MLSTPILCYNKMYLISVNTHISNRVMSLWRGSSISNYARRVPNVPTNLTRSCYNVGHHIFPEPVTQNSNCVTVLVSSLGVILSHLNKRSLLYDRGLLFQCMAKYRLEIPSVARSTGTRSNSLLKCAESWVPQLAFRLTYNVQIHVRKPTWCTIYLQLTQSLYIYMLRACYLSIIRRKPCI
jgi:hypothetical protein